jgi:hypothetical protein
MLRRKFLKLSSALAVSPIVPVGLGVSAMAQKAHAASPNYSALTVEAPGVMPQVINVFMYGGASELAGNLSNIEDIELHSVNSYVGEFGPEILRAEEDAIADGNVNDDDWQVTPDGFWRNAGGVHMQEMLDDNLMAVYRTIYKQKSPTRSHRESIFMSHKGTLDIESSPGIGSRLALMLKTHESILGSCKLADEQAVQDVVNADGSVSGFEAFTLPFVSFEGDSQTYAIDPGNPLPLSLRGLTMDDQFNNPYTRGSLTGSEGAILDLLDLRKAVIQSNSTKYGKANSGFDDRAKLDLNMEDLQDQLGLNVGTTSSAANLGVTYPGGTFSDQIEAAVTLALHNPQTLYMAVGTPGLGGWDDHNNGVDEYPDRMNDLMEAIKAGMAHIKAAEAGVTTISGRDRTQTNNIVINVFGDFGRLVNLNGSNGWDHANNQNLYTFGGAGVRPAKEAAALGSVVGTTMRAGTSKTNNQYTVPTKGVDGVPDSPTWEPMSIASSIYGYFGATNPEVMTASEGDEEGDVRLEDKL